MKVKCIDQATKEVVCELDGIPAVHISACFTENDKRYVFVSYNPEDNTAIVAQVSESYGKFDGAWIAKNPEEVKPDAKDKT